MLKRSLLAAFLGFSISIPAIAQDEGAEPSAEPINFDELSVEEAFALFDDNPGRWAREPCEFGAPLLDVITTAQPQNQNARDLSLRAQIFCADREGRYDNALALTRQYNTEFPDKYFVELVLYLAQRTEDVDLAFEALEWFEVERFKRLNQDSLLPVYRTIRQAGRIDELEDIKLRWFDERQIGFIPVEFHAGFALRALGSAVRNQRTEVVPRLLDAITSPHAYVDLPTDRSFEAIWPQIEERAGPNLEKIGAENVSITRQSLVLKTSDRDRFSDAARALHYHGDFEEAIELAERWRGREERGLAFEEGDGWALNIQAYAYDSLGQLESADAVFDQLAALEPEENPWVVNFVINRASRLVEYGRWEEGLEAAALARSVAENYGSTYARTIIAKDTACALKQLDREDEASTELAFLREKKKDGVGLTVQGLLCFGLRDEAVQLLLEAIADPATKGAALDTLERPEGGLFYTRSILPKARSLMEDYPELKAAYLEHRRDLPDAYVPRASLLRVELDLPEWE